ncbi:TadE/TadG family type IV pilus assembly protein [Bremerella sp.]|uniref:TadE/TadG family type IV pilus assembly protein n=1 Tax=Bremerella sp. TaxID=2795602 RepID=UPI00391B5FE0
MTQLHRRFDFLSKRARRGVSLLWIIIAFPALVLFLVFAVEIGNIWLARIELEQSLEANALAAVKHWAESTGSANTLEAREVGNSFSIANPVRGVPVDLTNVMLNSAFSNGNNRLNFDDRVTGAYPNQNLVCRDISEYNDYIQSGVMIFGAITQIENEDNPVDPSQSVIFDADETPTCLGGSDGAPLLVDATGNGTLGSGSSMGVRNAWGISFGLSTDSDINANLRIDRIEIDVDPNNVTGYEFVPINSNGTGPLGLISNEMPSMNLDPLVRDNEFVSNHLSPASDIVFSAGSSDSTLVITFGTALNPLQLQPGDRFRFGARVNTGNGNSQVDADGVGAVGTEIRVFYSYNGQSFGPFVTNLVDTNDEKDCDDDPNTAIVTDALGIDHYIGSPSQTEDLPCPASNGVNNNGQSYVRSFLGGAPRHFAVRSQATIGVRSVVQSICGFELGPWGVSAKATAYYDCETRDPKLIRVDVFECDARP